MTRRTAPRCVATAAAALLVLSACENPAPEPSTQTALAGTLERYCLASVAETAGDADVTVLGRATVPEGRLIRVGVGPDRIPFDCIVSRDGRAVDLSDRMRAPTSAPL